MINDIKVAFTLLLLIISFFGCGLAIKVRIYTEPLERQYSQVIHEGILCTAEQQIKYQKNGKTCAVIELSEPVMVAQADQEEEWGFFQFPKIGKEVGGNTLFVYWQMKKDSPHAFGTKSPREYKPMMSKDGGETWQPQDKSYNIAIKEYNVRFDDGGTLLITVPKSPEIKSYKRFPKPVDVKGGKSYYAVEKLPEELQGVYFSYRNHGINKNVHAKLKDPGLLRYSVDGVVPVTWWGDIKEMKDKSLIAGVYPCYYLDNKGSVLPCGVSFYYSTDKGNTWNLRGKVPSLHWEEINGLNGDGGFSEPTFEILLDGTFVCVMRTGSFSPMFQSFSYDEGRTWTNPKVIAPNGVYPQLMLLNNGVLVLSSGRPGIQLRFSFDGTGKEWTEPFDMLQFMNKDGSFTRDVSCGYSSIIEADDESFYIVYSDFTTKNAKGEARKSIWFRKVTVRI